MNLLQKITEKATRAGHRFRETKQLQGYIFLPPIAMLFASCLIVANITAQKPIHIFFFTVPGGSFVFPIFYMLANIVTEVYGYKWARLMIWGSMAANTMVFFYMSFTIWLPSVSFWKEESAYHSILGLVPLIVFASGLAYLVGEHVNSMILSKLKIMMKGNRLWLRVIISTTIGALIDSLIFIPIVFTGTASIYEMLILAASLIFLKVGYEVLSIPFTYSIIYFLKAAEKLDVYDLNTKFTPFSLDLYYSDDEKNGRNVIPIYKQAKS